MPTYLALIYRPEAESPAPTTPEWRRLMQAYGTFIEEARKSGVFKDGNPLQPIATATTVRIRDGKTLMIDGPFAETKEQLGGYCLLECGDLDEALYWAARIPDAANGSIEVRPVREV
ncbi:MAG TPA: YciI family protein [Chloroflexota bacterium]|nr:YciI family protein [Chloroflexota bacterium]